MLIMYTASQKKGNTILMSIISPIFKIISLADSAVNNYVIKDLKLVARLLCELLISENSNNQKQVSWLSLKFSNTCLNR